MFVAKLKRLRKVDKINRLPDKYKISKNKIQTFDHHLCHAATAYYGWGKTDEDILVVTLDGGGDYGIAGSVNIGRNGELIRKDTISIEDTVASLYSKTTFMLGMVSLEHEYKLMGRLLTQIINVHLNWLKN
ncbi:MAG: hypothetical protein K8S16_21875 [Bacteroidales bacterium]|nr:hypothetical protein [Bacteroidales bacterium]